MDDSTWIEVIQSMDKIYADLLHYQVELEQKNAALEESEHYISSVLEAMHDVLIVCDINGKIEQVNVALEKLTGKTAKTLKGQFLAEMFTGEFAYQIQDFPIHIRSDHVIDCEVNMLDKDGEPSPLAVNCTPRYDHKGRLSGMVLTGRPLGELRRSYHQLHQTHEQLKTTQQQLIQSEKMASLGRMVAGVAHELNNPISFIYSNMYALQGYEKRFQEYLNIVHQNLPVDVREKARQKLRIDSLLADIHPLIEASIEGAERVSKIVQNLGRYAASKQDNFTILNLSKLIENALRWVIRSVSNKPQLKLDLPEELMISNSEGHLHQIFINLLQNALDALEDNPNPVIEIYAKKDKDKAVVTVRDNGQGIDEDKLLCVFEPFFTTKPVGKGTGLGLYISYGLATNQCGGSLEVVNHAAGGAIFTLKLPLQNREEHHV